MKLWNEYFLAHTIEEAVNRLSSAEGSARPIAGGTDLILELQQGRHAPIHTLVDVSQIEELACLEVRESQLFIGAGVCVSQVVNHPLVRLHAQAVAEACNLIGGPQVRNMATLGGNVAHALPAADGMISLVAMDARVEIAGPSGRRTTPILSLFKSIGESTLSTGEILTGFWLPLRQPGQSSAFNRVMRPQGVALPILNMAVWLQRSGDCIEQIRIAAGPAGPTPRRAVDVEQFLTGKPFTPDYLAQAVALLKSTSKFRTSARRATSEYRYHLSGVLLEDIFHAAWERTETLEAI